MASACRCSKVIGIGSGQWPSPTTRHGSRRGQIAARLRSGMQAVASAYRRSKAIAVRSSQWPSPTTQHGSRQG